MKVRLRPERVKASQTRVPSLCIFFRHTLKSVCISFILLFALLCFRSSKTRKAKMNTELVHSNQDNHAVSPLQGFCLKRKLEPENCSSTFNFDFNCGDEVSGLATIYFCSTDFVLKQYRWLWLIVISMLSRTVKTKMARIHEIDHIRLISQPSAKRDIQRRFTTSLISMYKHPLLSFAETAAVNNGRT